MGPKGEKIGSFGFIHPGGGLNGELRFVNEEFKLSLA
jgi:hypothetical protein